MPLLGGCFGGQHQSRIPWEQQISAGESSAADPQIVGVRIADDCVQQTALSHLVPWACIHVSAFMHSVECRKVVFVVCKGSRIHSQAYGRDICLCNM